MANIDINVKSVGETLLDGLITAGALKVSALFLLNPEATIAQQPLAFVAVLGAGALAWEAARSWVAFT